MDTTTSLKMTSLAVQSLFSYVEEENLVAVRAHLDKFRDVDCRSDDCWTALISAAKEGHFEVVKELLENNANLEHRDMHDFTSVLWPNSTVSTPLSGRLDGAMQRLSIFCCSMEPRSTARTRMERLPSTGQWRKKGDTALHIAIRGRSRKLAELLLRNPKDGRLLYRPNKAGETPYNIDCTHQKSILTQIFGANGDMLGYDLYSSALADILSEPTMQPPICVGLYAQWGSGKSFLLKKLEDEMKTFAGQQIEPLFQFSWLVVLLTLLLCGSVAIVLGFTVDPKLAIAVSLSLLALLYIFFGEETNKLEVVY
ncbi:hypothetical protein GOODEAATRI_000474 [Goodea atripinnis]|uniref:KAP NTPase domain-containing protein n=1 Tax=Goodea atripinnis TaxID=208336 RepID=A0ABV0MN67_9TELE